MIVLKIQTRQNGRAVRTLLSKHTAVSKHQATSLLQVEGCQGHPIVHPTRIESDQPLRWIIVISCNGKIKPEKCL